MKEIQYDIKITNATTQYHKITKEDMAYLQMTFIRYMALMGELSKSSDRNIKGLVNQYWRKKTDTLPKGRNGQNTPESFIGGLLNNLMFGKQNDLSDIQMDAITNISSMMEQIYDAVEKLELQKDSDKMETIIFRQRLFTIG